MEITTPILTIQDLLDRWRALGTRKLANGTELIGEVGDGSYVHAVFPGLESEEISEMESQLGVTLPPRLSAMYRRIGGMTLFSGAFQVLSPLSPGILWGDHACQPGDILQHNHRLDAIGWRPSGAAAFAVNAWDHSLHMIGMGKDREEIARCDLATGEVTEVHSDVFGCIADRLTKVDALMDVGNSLGVS